MAKEPPSSTGTRWSLIVRAQGSGTQRRAALNELVGYYDKYISSLLRNQKRPPDSSLDELKQEFLEGLVRRNDIDKLDRARGSFRGWLNLAVRRFVAHEWEKWHAASNGRKGTTSLIFEVIDLSAAPDDASIREFAVEVLTHTLSLQRSEARDPARFDALARFLPGPQMDLVEQGPLARELGITQNTLATSIFLMRTRYRELLRRTIADLIDAHPEPGLGGAPALEAERSCARAVDEELRELRQHFLS